MKANWRLGGLLLPALFATDLACAAPAQFFSTGDPDGRMAMASRPGAASQFEIETADDFVLSQGTRVSAASFTGLLAGGASIQDLNAVRVEVYRVFPDDSDATRTSGPPTFSTPSAPTRVNSPADLALAERGTAAGDLNFGVTAFGSFTANNSVAPGGIHPTPGQTTDGNGPLTGQEVRFDVTFTTPFDLPADHYFFVPQVGLATGAFYWLSAPRPIVPSGTPFSPDLQAWTRDQNLDPDWLRVGTDIVGGSPAPTFNASFSLTGEAIPAVPEPASPLLFALGGLALLATRRHGSRA